MLVLIKIAYCNIHTINIEKACFPLKILFASCMWPCFACVQSLQQQRQPNMITPMLLVRTTKAAESVEIGKLPRSFPGNCTCSREINQRQVTKNQIIHK